MHMPTTDKNTLMGRMKHKLGLVRQFAVFAITFGFFCC